MSDYATDRLSAAVKNAGEAIKEGLTLVAAALLEIAKQMERK